MKHVNMRVKHAHSIRAFLLITLIVVLLECTVFNARYWATSMLPPETNAMQYDVTLDGVSYIPSGGYFLPDADGVRINISAIDENIRTVFIEPYWSQIDKKATHITIAYIDENFEHHTDMQVINGYEPSYFLSLGAMGKVSDVSIILRDGSVGVRDISFNAPMPWVFQWLRVIGLIGAAFAIYLCKKHNFSRILFNPQSVKQKGLEVAVLSSFIMLILLVLIFSVDFGFIPNSGNELRWQTPESQEQHIINSKVVEALLNGQLHLDIAVHESLLNAEQPYSFSYRQENGVVAPWDHVFFEGKFYSYFGIVPVIVLFLPYYIITGGHLSATHATVLFCMACAVGIYFLWRESVRKYLKDIPYSLYLGGLAAALFSSNLLLLAVRAHNYEATAASGLMFSIWGVFFLIRAVRNCPREKIKAVFLCLGGTCMALAVGCRPTMLLASLVVPFILFPAFSGYFPLTKTLREPVLRKSLIINLLALALPYMLVGAGLAWYNYARFGSMLEFGANYQITRENVSVMTQSGVLGNMRRAVDGIFGFFFNNLALRPQFPFVVTTWPPTFFTGWMTRQATIGAFMLPITWFLPAVFFIKTKDTAEARYTIFGMTISSLLIATMIAVMVGLLARYTVDLFWLIMIASLMSIGLLHKEAQKTGDAAGTIIRRLGCAAIFATCFIAFGWGMVGEDNYIALNNPVIFRYLSDLFSIL